MWKSVIVKIRLFHLMSLTIWLFFIMGFYFRHSQVQSNILYTKCYTFKKVAIRHQSISELVRVWIKGHLHMLCRLSGIMLNIWSVTIIHSKSPIMNTNIKGDRGTPSCVPLVKKWDITPLYLDKAVGDE